MQSATSHLGASTTTLTRQHGSDSRLLSNLIKTERSLILHLDESVKAAYQASSALSAWATSEAPDISNTASQLSGLLNDVADCQRNHVQALDGYRSALKDILDREQGIRTIVRDRDILVSRLLKASKKTKGSEAEKQLKVANAQRELQACEQVLSAEETALVGVKRRTFKEALTMRMKTMGDTGAGMVDAARDAILLLDDFDSVAGVPALPPREHDADASGDWTQYGQEDPSHHDGRMSAQFENGSVTPSQSASQVQYHPRPQSSLSRLNYSAENGLPHTNGIADSPDIASRQLPEAHEEEEGSDTDSDEDYRQAFSDAQTHTNTNLPAPHQLSTGAGTTNEFLPRVTSPAPPRRNAPAAPSTPAPTPPRKDAGSRLSMMVPMPAVPTAPRLNLDGTNLGPIPRAPQLYVSGARRDSSSSDEEPRPTTAHSGWSSQRRQDDDASSDEGATATPAKKSSGFFGRMGRLFKADLPKDKPSPKRQASTISRGPEPAPSRRHSLLRGNLAQEPDSSDEEREQRDLVRHTNPRRPLWQGEKASSDIGNVGRHRSLLKRHPSITPGPQSAVQVEAARASVIGAGIGGGSTSGLTNGISTATPVRKTTKVKKRSSTTGSEVGTTSTRLYAPAAPSSGARKLADSTTPSDIGRSDSLTRSAGAAAQGSISRSSTRGSVRSVDGTKRKKRTSLQSLGANDFEGKFNTGSWVNKDGGSGGSAVGHMTAAEVASNAGKVPVAPAAASASAPSPAPTSNVEHGTHTPTKNAPAPLKPALKTGSLSRKTGASASSAASSPDAAASLGPPISAPPAASTLLQNSSAASMPRTTLSSAPPRLPELGSGGGPATNAPVQSSLLSIEEDKAFDGTGQLDVSLDGESSKTDARTVTPQKKAKGSVPKLEMPQSEPFSVNLDADGQRIRDASAGSSSPGLMTPGAREAYEHILSQEPPSPIKAAMPATKAAHGPQPEGVTRTTERTTRLAPSRTYGTTPLTGDSSDDSDVDNTTTIAQPTAQKGSVAAARSAAEHQTNLAFSNLQGDSTLQSLATGLSRGLSPRPGGMTKAGAASDTSSGAGVERRKSVRIAADTKLPPDTPTDDFSTPMADTRSDPFAAMTVPTAPRSALSSRIAPPPPAPARLPKPDGPVDLGGTRERSGWSTRIGQNDDSSDEEENEYTSARKAFGSASRHLGQATGSIKSKKKSTAAAEPDVPSRSASKKKKADTGYNPAIPLPAGMEVVGRSPSTKKKSTK